MTFPAYILKRARRLRGDYFSILYHGVRRVVCPRIGHYTGGRIEGYRPPVTLPGSGEVVLSAEGIKRIAEFLTEFPACEKIFFSRIVKGPIQVTEEGSFRKIDKDGFQLPLGGEPESLIELAAEGIGHESPSYILRLNEIGFYSQVDDKIILNDLRCPPFFRISDTWITCCRNDVAKFIVTEMAPYGVDFIPIE